MKIPIPLLFLPLALVAAQEPEIKTEFLAVAIHEPVDGLHFLQGETVREITGSLTGFGQPIPYEGPARLVLHGSPDAFFGDPPATPPLAVVDLPAGADRIMLLLFKRPEEPLRVVALPVHTDSLRPGDYRVFNFSSVDVRMLLDEETLSLRPGQGANASHADWKREVIDLPVRLGVATGNEVRLVYSSIWGHYPARRNFVFLFDGNRRSAPIVFRRMYDWPAAVQEE